VIVELQSSRDLLAWLVDVWESDQPRSGALKRGDSLIELAVAEGKIPDASIGTYDDFSQWFEDLRLANWIRYDDTDAANARFSGDSRRKRNDVLLSRNFVVTADAATWVKSSLTAALVGQVASNLAGLIGQIERGIEEVDAPEEAKEEARRLLRKAGETAVSSTAVELIVRVAFGLVGVHFR